MQLFVRSAGDSSTFWISLEGDPSWSVPTSSKAQGPKAWSISARLPTLSCFLQATPILAHCFVHSFISFPLCISPLSPLLSFPPPTSLSTPIIGGAYSCLVIILFSTLRDGTHFHLHKISPRTVFITLEHSFCGQAHARRDSSPKTLPGSLLPCAPSRKACTSRAAAFGSQPSSSLSSLF